MAEMKNVPAIRFEGFIEAWRYKKIVEIAPLQRGFDLPKSQMEKGEYPVVMSNGINGYHSEFMAKGPGVVTGRSGTIGNVHLIETNYWPHNTALWVTEFYGNYPSYIYYLYKRLDLNRFGTGSGVPTLNRNDVHDKKVYIPDPHEQIEISNFLQYLDKHTSLHQARVNKLTNLKKAMLEKMFPQQGADVPEIRFKGFEGAWEEKDLGDEVADIVGGGTPNTFEPTYWNGDIDWYSPTEIGTKVFANSSVKKITELGLQNSSAKLLPANQTILFTSRAGIGDMAILKRVGATNQGFQSLVLKDGYDPYFVYSMGRLIKDYAIKYSSGSTFLEISGKVLGKMVIKVPSLTEQEKIGTYFQNLDELITLNQSELDKLNNLKKACLEKMFV